MSTLDEVLGRIDNVLAAEERARTAWLASTTPGAPATVQRALGSAVRSCPPRPPEPPTARPAPTDQAWLQVEKQPPSRWRRWFRRG